MSDLRLFDVPALPEEATRDDGQLSDGQRLTIRNRNILDAGHHPATRRPLLAAEWGFTCGDCANCYGSNHGRRTFWKCRRHVGGHTHGPATDIRLFWPACVLFRLDPEASP